ncbi:MAG: hypothetical protein HQL84_16400 [Magnetococcales bacterium]|nr:hypothetical protein [Magnetococcales bacterium]MBF0151602.1 hypothetical protein [Magnetococcales bacterium]
MFLLADSNMKGAFEGFFSREAFHRSIGCGPFRFVASEDLVVAAGDNDPGLFTRGHELLRPYQQSHQYALVVLDAAWEGSPGAERIWQKVSANLLESGWSQDRFHVVVIEPELETWIWQQNPHVATALGFDDVETLMADDLLARAWTAGQPKPSNPKETLETLLRKKRIPRSSAIYQKITSKVSVRQCRDASFLTMVEILRGWFPEVTP